jgi:hypothetical protein
VPHETAHGSDRPVVGICCSGGGIRAASFALGALQTLQENGQLHGESKATHLSAVSGGSYIVGAMASIQKSIEDAPSPAPNPIRPFAPGSPEEHRLRNRLGYLTHGPGGLPRAAWRIVLGILVNVTLLGSTVLIAGVAAGWIYGFVLPQLRWYYGDPRSGHQFGSTNIVPPPWLVAVFLGIAAVAVVLGLISVTIRPRSSAKWLAVSGLILVIGALAAVFVLGLPQLLGWLHRSTIPHPHQGARTTSRNLSWWSLTGLAAAVAGAVGAGAPIWRLVHTGLSEMDKQPSWVRRVLMRIRKPALNLLATIVGPLLVIGTFVLFAKQAAADPPFRPFSAGAAIAFWASLVGLSVLLLVLMNRYGNLNTWALHSLYEDRLHDAFGVQRCPSPTPGWESVEVRDEPLRLSESQPEDFPEVLICATANVPKYGVAPTAVHGGSFLLSAAWVGGLAEISGICPTDDYEQWGLVERTDLSLTTAVSISGAAVAPEMGKETRRPLRFLLALANIRLGVWLPKPNRLDRVRDGRTPGLSYLLLHEMLGLGGNPSFVYVTDGGHYDNLGLVELFRQRCEWIWCIDASGDDIDTFSTLGGALAMAEAELGVTVDIHPSRDMAPAPGSRFVRQPFCFGSVTYHDALGNVEMKGGLGVVKAGVPENAPWSVRSYHADHPQFPCDPTLDQLYTADRFDAYVELGRFSMREAWEALHA